MWFDFEKSKVLFKFNQTFYTCLVKFDDISQRVFFFNFYLKIICFKTLDRLFFYFFMIYYKFFTE